MGQSWSGLRKTLEQDLLCEKLRGRVQYFITHYHGAPDEYGRVAIRVDGVEVIRGNPYDYYVRGYHHREMAIKKERGIPRRVYSRGEMLHDEEHLQVEREVKAQAMAEGVFELYDVTDAIRAYTQSPIADSLKSEIPLVRLLAVLDRRVGKRTLQELAKTVEEQPAWLQFFYRLRLEAEGITPSASHPS